MKNTRKNAYDLRQEFLWQQALAEEIAGNKNASKHFKQLSRIEAIIRKFKKLRKYFSHKLSSQTKNIAIKNTHNEWITIDDPKKMNEYIIKHSQQHFNRLKIIVLLWNPARGMSVFPNRVICRSKCAQCDNSLYLAMGSILI